MNITNLQKALLVFWNVLPLWIKVTFPVLLIVFTISILNPSISNYDSTRDTEYLVQANKNGIVGTWYDDLGSPNYLDATFTIMQRGDSYTLYRRNGDGSSGSFYLRRDGNKFIKVGDKFGAYYVVSRSGLDIFDSKGFIRKAREM
ncbi:hypothetical protein QFX18_19115 [Saccharophagus degradans]|uniref:hypothetical protein n=1 Tax=Saccharophagus degradans TaxID=86304 RepID=UPI00247817AB|nr:hypothetical protein [Saccharophagus degradans]WGO98120.1 hypothetical protein QFX18_19115 [Saccharophagus degradans]